MLRHKTSLALVVSMVATLCARADSVDDFVMAQMRTQQIQGVVLVVVKDGEIVTQRAYGVANIEFNVPMKPGSLSKAVSPNLRARYGRDPHRSLPRLVELT